jgi:hypothetical protein
LSDVRPGQVYAKDGYTYEILKVKTVESGRNHGATVAAFCRLEDDWLGWWGVGIFGTQMFGSHLLTDTPQHDTNRSQQFER